VTSLTEPSCTSGRRKLFRQLQTETSTIEAQYEVIIDTICRASDCSDVQELANQVYEQVTGDLKAAIDDGSLIASIAATVQTTYADLATTFMPIFQEATLTGDFSPLVIPVVAALSKWYPDWQGVSNSCKNDGNEPLYMKKNGGYYESSLDACCERHFNWDKPTCISVGGGNPSDAATGKWYVNHEKEICQQDCTEETGGPCGGLANRWDALHETAEDCCEQRLGWKITSVCEAQSTLQTVVGTSLWYVDWSDQKCVKDCDDSSDSACGGLAKKWDDVYDSVSDCCDRIWYIERAECTDE